MHLYDMKVETIREEEGVKWRERMVEEWVWSKHDIQELKSHCETHYYIQFICTNKTVFCFKYWGYIPRWQRAGLAHERALKETVGQGYSSSSTVCA